VLIRSIAERLPIRVRRVPDQAERGFTLVELTIAAALAVVVIGAFGSVMLSLLGVETRTVSGENTSTTMRSVVTQIQSDLQAATPTNSPINTPTGLDPLAAPFSASAPPFDNQIQIQIGPIGSQQTVTWTYDPVRGTLTRAVSSSPTATPTSTVTELTGVVDYPQPMFQYYGQQGGDVGDTAQSNADVSNCTVRVEVDLAVSSGKNAPVPQQALNVQLANVLSGSLACG